MTIEEYLNYLEAHGRAEKTLRGYHYKLHQARRALVDGGLSDDPAQATDNTFLYLRRILPGTEDTVKQILRAWDCYIQWSTGRQVMANMDLLWNRTQVQRTFISTEDFSRMVANFDVMF